MIHMVYKTISLYLHSAFNEVKQKLQAASQNSYQMKPPRSQVTLNKKLL